MTGADFLITLPEFPDKKVSIKDFGAVENQTDIAGSKRNAAAINSAMRCYFKRGRRNGCDSERNLDYRTHPSAKQCVSVFRARRGCKVFKKYRGVPADSDQLRGTGSVSVLFHRLRQTMQKILQSAVMV